MGFRFKYLTVSWRYSVSNRENEVEGDGEVVVFSANCWDRRSSEALIESATPCHDAEVVRPYQVSSPLRQTVLAAKSEAEGAGQRSAPLRYNTFNRLKLVEACLRHFKAGDKSSL